jgi:hypothetical protein
LSRDTEDVEKKDYIDACVSVRPSTNIVFYAHVFPAVQNIACDVVLVLTTKPDPAALASFSCPVIFIGSGSVTDALKQRSPAWTEYSLNKFWPERFATLTLRCGFFIPDTHGVIPPAGVGMDSARRIFGSAEITDPAWLEKKMYVTPVSELVDVIFKWINTPPPQRPVGVFHFGTECPYSRGWLRMEAQLPLPSDCEPTHPQPVYRDEYTKSMSRLGFKPIGITEACWRAREWISKI